MIQIQNLTITEKSDLRDIIHNLTLTINHGDKVVMIGEEGNGKSTLLKYIYQPEMITSYAEVFGKCMISDTVIGYLPQQLDEEVQNKTIYEYFCDNAQFLEEQYSQLVHIARQVQMPTDFYYSNQLIKTLSGGEKVKLQIANILISRPTLLLLDEPSNDLDLKTVEWLEEFMHNFSDTIVFISHDETLIEHVATKIIHLELLKRKQESKHTISSLPYPEYKAQRQYLFDRTMQKAMSDKREDEIRTEKYRRIQQKVEHDLRTISRQDPHGGQLLKKKMKSVKSMGKRFDRERENMTEVPIQEEAIGIHFDHINILSPNKNILNLQLNHLMIEDRILSSNISLSVYGQDKICLIGTNGCGKSTLLKKIYEDLRNRNDLLVAYMPQDYDDVLNPALSPIEFLAPNADKESVIKARQYLGAMRYTSEEMNHPMKKLSGGQRGKILILKMILDQANVLLLDEPTRNFSPLSSPVICQMFNDFPGTIISVSHDRTYIASVCTKVYELCETGLRLIK